MRRTNLTPQPPSRRGKGEHKVSVVIPTRKEHYLVQTVRELLANAAGEVEICIGLDGPDHFEIPQNETDRRIKLIDLPQVVGRRKALEAAAAVATGKYIMKIDAHCRIGEGWDEILKAECEDNWIVIPRRYWLDPATWSIIENKKPVDAMYYLYPFIRPFRPMIAGRPWYEYSTGREDILLDEDMTDQGSCYFMRRELWDYLNTVKAEGYGTFYGEPEELVFPLVLGERRGKVMRNKKTWYAHWGKPNSHWIADPQVEGRCTPEDFEMGRQFVFDYWWYNRDPRQVRTYQDLIQEWMDKAGPLPDYPEDWRTRHLQAWKRYGDLTPGRTAVRPYGG